MAITLDGTAGITTPGLTNTGTETLVNLTSTGNTTLGDATTDTLTVGVTGIVKDASGKVGIGTSSPADKLDIVVNSASTDPVFGGTSNNGIRLQNTNSTVGNFASILNVNSAGTLSSLIAFRNVDQNTPNTAGAIDFVTRNGGSLYRAMTVTQDGNLLVGTTTSGYPTTNAISLRAQYGDAIVAHPNGTASGTTYMQFAYNGGGIGTITQNGTTGVLYNLTSDYRLKNDQQSLTGAKEFVMALQPKKWQWWDGSGEGVGFIAHEFMQIAKYSGNGTKDAIDADGKPIYQSIQPSSSEVMANLVAFIQEQQALIQSLTNRITALEIK
jgi:Chaperone of endosialidase